MFSEHTAPVYIYHYYLDFHGDGQCQIWALGIYWVFCGFNKLLSNKVLINKTFFATAFQPLLSAAQSHMCANIVFKRYPTIVLALMAF